MSFARAFFFFSVLAASHASAQSEEVVPPPPSYGAPTPDPTTAPPLYVPPAAPPPSNAVYVPPGAPVYTPAAVPRERRVIDWGLVGGGIGLFAGGWLATFVSTIVWYSATTSCSSSFGFPTDCSHVGGPGGTGLLFSFIPVVGPWLMLTDSYLDTPGEMVFPVIAGLVQDAGLILLIVGLATMHTETVVEEARRAGDVRVSGGAAPSGLFGSLDVVF